MPDSRLAGKFAHAAILASLLVLTPLSSAFAGGKLPATLKELKFDKISFKLPKTARVQLKNGMVLHMLVDHELPVVDISARVRIGSAWVPAEKAGLAELTGATWRAGGTVSLQPEAMDQKLERMATVLETGVGGESGSVTLKTLSRDLDESLALLADVVKNPAFEAKRFAVAKNQMLENIKREEDDPETLVDREFTKKVFAGHPFGASPAVATVEGLTREECERFYRDHVGPESFIFGIAGDFDPVAMAGKFEALFSDFRPAAKKLPPLPAVPEAVAPGIYLIDKDLPQTNLRFGHIGISRKNPDWDTVRVLNYVLGGGGFASRLMREVRSVRGLAYSVWSYFTGGDMDRGAFIIGGETKVASTAEFYTVSVALLRDVIEKGITPAELEQAKESLINSFMFAFDKNADVVARYVWMEYYNMPEGYLEGFRGRVEAVTSAKVLDAARKYLHPDGLVVVAVGNRKAIESQLAAFGEVKPGGLPK